jgi:DNA-binding winged helix-turn-helix (wHTH) protein
MSVTSSWHFPPFHLDCASSSLWREGQLVPLPPKPFAVLAHLVSHAGEVVTKEDLLDSVWPDTTVTEGVLKGCIRQLRQVLDSTLSFTVRPQLPRPWLRRCSASRRPTGFPSMRRWARP